MQQLQSAPLPHSSKNIEHDGLPSHSSFASTKFFETIFVKGKHEKPFIFVYVSENSQVSKSHLFETARIKKPINIYITPTGDKIHGIKCRLINLLVSQLNPSNPSLQEQRPSLQDPPFKQKFVLSQRKSETHVLFMRSYREGGRQNVKQFFRIL